jgi:TonB family protein
LDAADRDGDEDANENTSAAFPAAIEGVCGCVLGAIAGTVSGLDSVSLPALGVAPELPSTPLRAGRAIPIPIKLVDVKPTYPPLARHLRTQGTVVLDAGIDETGRVVDVRVLQSIGLFDRAAIDAVRRWRYAPAVVNGRAVPVVLTVTVAFVL